MVNFPNLRGKELGYNIEQFKKSFDDFNEYVLDNDTEKNND